MIEKNAVVRWVSHNDGGRRSPPTGEEPPAYWAVVKFIDTINEGPEPPTNSWSLVVHRVQPLIAPDQWNARVYFRADGAPDELLVDGAKFELYEGKKRVAFGEVTKHLARHPR